MTRQCQYTKPSGVRCGAPALHGKRHCVFHDRASRARTAEGRRQGGLNRKALATTLPPDTPPLKLESVEDVRAALAECYNLVRVGRLAVNVGNCLAVVGQALMKSLEGADLERRLEELEARLSAGRVRRAT